MSSHRYAIGSTVYFWRRLTLVPSGSGAFRVIAQYPGDASGGLYRIRSVLGTEERMAPEHELSEAPRTQANEASSPRRRPDA